MPDRNQAEISKALDVIIQGKSRETVAEMVLLGVLAGVYIGFGAFAYTTVTSFAGLPEALSRFLGGTAFCVGLILVVIPGSELFTGNILMAAGLVNRKVALQRVVRNWFCVYLGNFIGALLLAVAIYGTGLMGSAAEPSVVGLRAADIASTKIALPIGEALLRGVLCNMLVCLAVILTVAARTVTGKILGIYFPIMVFVVSGFEHSIANMYLLPAGLLAGGTLLGDFGRMFHNLIPVTIGNIIGGLLVILLHPARIRRIIRPPTPDGRKGE